MSDIDLKFRTVRSNLRRCGNYISEDVFKRFHPSTREHDPEICVFCNSTVDITKEHVIPRWVFENNTRDSLISSVNRQVQTFNKAVVPTCAQCNNSVLSPIESYIIKLLPRLERKEVIDMADVDNLIRWLEILDYKCQVFDCRKRYIKYRDSDYDPQFAEIPVAWMRHILDLNPFKALSYLRNSQRRIIRKSKNGRFNSLVVMDPKQASFYFFFQPDEYIFVSFPMFKVALFYFLQKEFLDNDLAYKESIYILHKVLKS